MLYYLACSSVIYVRNSGYSGDLPLLLHTVFNNTGSTRRIEIRLAPGRPTDISQLINFNRAGFSLSPSVSFKGAPSHYVAQVDYSLLKDPYDINRVVESLSHHHGLRYQLAFTRILGEDDSKSAALFITSTGTTHLRLPLHAFVDDNLVAYFCLDLPAPLTELMVDDAIPLDHTTLSHVRRNLVRLLSSSEKDIRHVTFPITLFSLVPHLPHVSSFELTEPESHLIGAQSLERWTLSSLSPYSSNISILSLPAVVLTPKVRNSIATRFHHLQSLKIVSDATSVFTDLPLYKPGDFNHLRYLSFIGRLPQFTTLLPTLFPPFAYHKPGASGPSSYPHKFVRLTLQVPFLTNKYDMKHTFSAIDMYVPHVDSVRIHVHDWGPGEPKNGSWWTESHVPHDLDGQERLPGRLIRDFTHPCQENIGSGWNVGSKRGGRKVCRPCSKLRELFDRIGSA